ncbi:hypothetical protein A2U01_0059690 [Trifolium medium]|uniref:Uncharacterized protein n=1 Tax=Trifolium medium TaxID=97028 RepID=A0A392RQI4_9FABA|nr:hypothetical protein [Trifolium medium]
MQVFGAIDEKSSFSARQGSLSKAQRANSSKFWQISEHQRELARISPVFAQRELATTAV